MVEYQAVDPAYLHEEDNEVSDDDQEDIQERDLETENEDNDKANDNDDLEDVHERDLESENEEDDEEQVRK